MARHADFRFGVGWMVLGAAVLAASWRMDRLESLHINPWSAPGLLPGLLGLLLLVFGLALCLRGAQAASLPEQDATKEKPHLRITLALALSVIFAAGLLGRGLPFWLTSAAYLFVTILAFRWLDREPEASFSWTRALLESGAIAVVSGVLLAVLFEEVFLVRLP
jgi:hypothetical protein